MPIFTPYISDEALGGEEWKGLRIFDCSDGGRQVRLMLDLTDEQRKEWGRMDRLGSDTMDLTDTVTGITVRTRPAPCGESCYCAAEALEVVTEEEEKND